MIGSQFGGGLAQPTPIYPKPTLITTPYPSLFASSPSRTNNSLSYRKTRKVTTRHRPKPIGGEDFFSHSTSTSRRSSAEPETELGEGQAGTIEGQEAFDAERRGSNLSEVLEKSGDDLAEALEKNIGGDGQARTGIKPKLLKGKGPRKAPTPGRGTGLLVTPSFPLPSQSLFLPHPIPQTATPATTSQFASDDQQVAYNIHFPNTAPPNLNGTNGSGFPSSTPIEPFFQAAPPFAARSQSSVLGYGFPQPEVRREGTNPGDLSQRWQSLQQHPSSQVAHTFGHHTFQPPPPLQLPYPIDQKQQRYIVLNTGGPRSAVPPPPIPRSASMAATSMVRVLPEPSLYTVHPDHGHGHGHGHGQTRMFSTGHPDVHLDDRRRSSGMSVYLPASRSVSLQERGMMPSATAFSPPEEEFATPQPPMHIQSVHGQGFGHHLLRIVAPHGGYDQRAILPVAEQNDTHIDQSDTQVAMEADFQYQDRYMGADEAEQQQYAMLHELSHYKRPRGNRAKPPPKPRKLKGLLQDYQTAEPVPTPIEMNPIISNGPDQARDALGNTTLPGFSSVAGQLQGQNGANGGHVGGNNPGQGGINRLNSVIGVPQTSSIVGYRADEQGQQLPAIQTHQLHNDALDGNLVLPPPPAHHAYQHHDTSAAEREREDETIGPVTLPGFDRISNETPCYNAKRGQGPRATALPSMHNRTLPVPNVPMHAYYTDDNDGGFNHNDQVGDSSQHVMVQGNMYGYNNSFSAMPYTANGQTHYMSMPSSTGSSQFIQTPTGQLAYQNTTSPSQLINPTDSAMMRIPSAAHTNAFAYHPFSDHEGDESDYEQEAEGPGLTIPKCPSRPESANGRVHPQGRRDIEMISAPSEPDVEEEEDDGTGEFVPGRNGMTSSKSRLKSKKFPGKKGGKSKKGKAVPTTKVFSPPTYDAAPAPANNGDDDTGSYENGIKYTSFHEERQTDQVKRECFNCGHRDPPSWRRSSCAPARILCNRCGIYEKSHRRPRPIVREGADTSVAYVQSHGKKMEAAKAKRRARARENASKRKQQAMLAAGYTMDLGLFSNPGSRYGSRRNSPSSDGSNPFSVENISRAPSSLSNVRAEPHPLNPAVINGRTLPKPRIISEPYTTAIHQARAPSGTMAEQIGAGTAMAMGGNELPPIPMLDDMPSTLPPMMMHEGMHGDWDEDEDDEEY